MSFSNFLGALQGNYGDEGAQHDDTDTVRGLLSFCKRWPTGQVRARELERPCAQMAGRLRAEAAANQKDLDTNHKLPPVVKAPIERMAEAYLTIAEVLEDLPSLAQQDFKEGYLEALEIFAEERQAILDSNAALEAHISGKVALCPCCGAAGDGPMCAKCGLLRLFPDPGAAARPAGGRRRATLSGVYGDVYKAQLAVAEGKASLDDLEQTLLPLEAHLRDLVQAHHQFGKSDLSELEEMSAAVAKDFAAMLKVVRPEIDRAMTGIARLRSVGETRQMADLNRGWDEIFDAARVIDGGLRRLRIAYGAHSEDPLASTQDTVELNAA